MESYIIVSDKTWHRELFNNLKNKIAGNWYFFSTPEELSLANLKKISPRYIFFTYWSLKIEEAVYKEFTCILFHLTDLPYGRGGSPLQNLILRKHASTKLTALAVAKEMDAGDIYLKKDLTLEGKASDIFKRAMYLIEPMITEIIYSNPKPIPQHGTPVIFKRRKPEDNNLSNITEISTLYDYIRMLDADGYPKAFIENEHFRFEFDNAEFKNDKLITANVRIIKK
jgi:methionyl-tRNA formyltransferase